MGWNNSLSEENNISWLTVCVFSTLQVIGRVELQVSANKVSLSRHKFNHKQTLHYNHVVSKFNFFLTRQKCPVLASLQFFQIVLISTYSTMYEKN